MIRQISVSPGWHVVLTSLHFISSNTHTFDNQLFFLSPDDYQGRHVWQQGRRILRRWYVKLVSHQDGMLWWHHFTRSSDLQTLTPLTISYFLSPLMIIQVDMSVSGGGGYSEINDTSKQRWRLNSLQFWFYVSCFSAMLLPRTRNFKWVKINHNCFTWE